MPEQTQPVHAEQAQSHGALREIALPPWREVMNAWSWKTAAISAILRAGIFFWANLHAGGHHAFRAMLVEAVFAVFASGLLGAVTQSLRDARPLWATALTVWFMMPGLMLVAQAAVHHAFGTRHLRAGLVSSFIFASVASGFTWFAMRRGTLLAGDVSTSVADDAKAMPRVIADFVMAGPKAVVRSIRD